MKIFKNLVGKFHDKPGSLRGRAVAGSSSDVSALDHEKISPAKIQRGNAAAHCGRHEDRTLPPAIVSRRLVGQEEISERNCPSFIATVTQPHVVEAPTTPPESIWNSAYDKLGAEELKLVEEYELILSYHHNSKTVSWTALTSISTPTGLSDNFFDVTGEKNMMEKENTQMRRVQMYQLVNNGSFKRNYVRQMSKTAYRKPLFLEPWFSSRSI
ncbi:hypothetical protein THARTR1_04313 [Trichoderma harzianum]|uniref:Uncharacterized protein n=1 Tax=Trichoderma harzianum TaxID=5544 RepID=A0A2K0UCI8_TRIHA|nr:hypothetical protein THARTR1_04313 [Trichoderma harzianum]